MTGEKATASMRNVLLWGLGLCVLIAGVLSAFASSNPDGLEFVAESLGFGESATSHAAEGSPVADYVVRGLGDGPIAGGLAGLIGVAVVALVAFGLMRLLKRSAPAPAPAPAPTSPQRPAAQNTDS